VIVLVPLLKVHRNRLVEALEDLRVRMWGGAMASCAEQAKYHHGKVKFTPIFCNLFTDLAVSSIPRQANFGKSGIAGLREASSAKSSRAPN
jgi:hypothetical protein